MIVDSLGHEIQIGDEVIYNLSGELAYGRIKRAVITETRKITWGSGTRDIYLIEIEYIKSKSVDQKPNNGISKVRNPACVIVLKGLK